MEANRDQNSNGNAFPEMHFYLGLGLAGIKRLSRCVSTTAERSGAERRLPIHFQ